MDILLLWTTFLLGLRHSLDVDHLAAITDISAAQSSKKTALIGCLAYAIGHAGIVFVLGGLALLVGFSIPAGLSTILEKVVGITLLVLAGAVVYSAIKVRDQGRIVSRWRILYQWAQKLTGQKQDGANFDDLGFKGCLLIGALHGIGVESPTQLLALGSAAALGDYMVGFSVISIFAAGMILSNMVIAFLCIYGFQNARKRQAIFFWLSLLSAALSAFIGLKLLFF
ncbi:MAG: hypothetical protein K2W82_11465 [Candidatus Obscuribacterales bacterium]|nr:hypothetical protein [Candidatus Obscuribacterales bacterium]